MIRIVLAYMRNPGDVTSRGHISRDGQELAAFEADDYQTMLTRLVRVLTAENVSTQTVVEVVLQRTDREGLLPYRLDDATVHLLRTDPVAAMAAMNAFSRSPSQAVRRVQETRTPQVPPPVRAGHDTLADVFGDVLYFKVRQHELECPGCGYWGMYTSPGLLLNPERAGAVIKNVFVCPKKCRARFVVTCQKSWGYVSTEYLLENTALPAFYFPREWNDGQQWISREALQMKFNEYKVEKENASCLETAQ